MVNVTVISLVWAWAAVIEEAAYVTGLPTITSWTLSLKFSQSIISVPLHEDCSQTRWWLIFNPQINIHVSQHSISTFSSTIWYILTDVSLLFSKAIESNSLLLSALHSANQETTASVNLLSDLPYLSHLERFLMFHTSLETKTPWRSTRQCNYHFFCNHCSVVFVFFFSFSSFCCWLLPLLFSFCISPGGPQYIGPIVSDQGPHRELWPALFLPHCPGADFSLSPDPRPVLTPENTHAFLCAHPYPEWANHQSPRKEKGRRRENCNGRGSVSAYTEECLPKMREEKVQCNTCPVTQTYATELLIAPPKIGHHHHLCCFACPSEDQGNVNIQNIQMALFHIWLYNIEVINNLL